MTIKQASELTVAELIDRLRFYASRYNMPPYGREIEGTDELMSAAADALERLANNVIPAIEKRR